MSRSDQLPRVSVVISAFNAAATIGAAISGVLTQDYPNIELLVVDDGSTDHTAEVVRGYGSQLALIQQENRGPAVARDVAIRASAGDLVAFCDADDFFLPHHVSTAVERLAAHPGRQIWTTANAISFGGSRFDPRARLLYYGDIPPAAQTDCILDVNFVPIFAVFPRSMYDEIGGFDPRLLRSEDWNLWARAILAGWRVTSILEPTAMHRQSQSSLSADHRAMRREEEAMLEVLLREHGDQMSASQRSRLRDRLVAGSPHDIRDAGRSALRAGHLLRARDLYLQASAMVPSDVRLHRQALAIQAVAGPYRWFHGRGQ